MNKLQPDKPSGIIFTDFDGTLFSSERTIADSNFRALETARGNGYITAIATGRSLFSFRRVAAKLERPIENYFDYLCFSSGAGLIKMDGRTRGLETELTAADMLEAELLPPAVAFDAASLLFRRGIDFMIQQAVPDNHYFTHVKSNGSVNPDYYRRIRIYEDFASPLDPGDGDSELERIERCCGRGVTQLVAVVPPSAGMEGQKYVTELIEYLRHRLAECSILRATSPIDHRSLWIEVFNPEVSKSKAADRLCKRLGLSAADALAVGNDFNDEDLLAWAGTGRTVDEAPYELLQAFRTAGRAADGAVAAAVREFLNGRPASTV